MTFGCRGGRPYRPEIRLDSVEEAEERRRASSCSGVCNREISVPSRPVSSTAGLSVVELLDLRLA